MTHAAANNFYYTLKIILFFNPEGVQTPGSGDYLGPTTRMFKMELSPVVRSFTLEC
jgi:hypothetical protein